MTTTIPIDVTPDHLLNAIQRMDDTTFDQFYRRLITIRAQRLRPSLDNQEQQLLVMITQAQLSPADHARLRLLANKLALETITADEQIELATLTERSEELNVERLTAVNQLATMRQQPFHNLMEELGLLNQYA